MKRKSLMLVAGVLLLLVGCSETARITGNNSVSRRDLRRAANRPLIAYATASKAGEGRPADLVDAVEAMRNRLDQAGHPLVQITVEPGDPPVFQIDEGPRVSVGTLTWTGDLGLSPEELTASAKLGTWYVTSAVSGLRNRITRRLRAAGFLNATVAPPKVTWAEDRQRADLAITVNAGRMYTVGSEKLVLDVSQAHLFGDLHVLLDQVGSPAHPRTAAEATARIRGYLINHGFRQATVDASTQIDELQGQLHVTVTVIPGPRFILRSVNVIGGARSADSFIQDRLSGLTVGQQLSQTQLDAAVTALSQTGLFRRVQAVPAAGSPEAAGPLPAQRRDDEVPADVTVTLNELPAKQLDLSLGYGSYERLRGGIEYIDSHLFGQGLRLTADIYGSLVGWGTTVELADPFRFGPGRQAAVDVGYEERQEPSYAHRDGTVGAVFSQRWQPPFDQARYLGRTSYRFKRSLDFRFEPNAVDADGNAYAADDTVLYTTSTIGVDLRRDSRRQQVIDPETGTLSSVGLSWSAKPLGADVDFVELTADVSGIWSMSEWLLLAVHAGGTTRDPLVVDSLPIGERLFLGGEDTVRSFTKDDLGPRDVSGNPLGGLTRGVANAEFRLRPFTHLRNLEFPIFYDLGCVDPRPWKLSSPAGQGVGSGVRYRTPVGPIRVDGAYNPGDDLGADQRWAIHVAVGFAF